MSEPVQSWPVVPCRSRMRSIIEFKDDCDWKEKRDAGEFMEELRKATSVMGTKKPDASSNHLVTRSHPGSHPEKREKQNNIKHP